MKVWLCENEQSRWFEFEEPHDMPDDVTVTMLTDTEQPAQQEPLTDEQIEACIHHVDEDGIGLFAFARAIEAAHGIKAPQPPVTQRTWVGLTKEEVDSWELPDCPTVFEFVQFIEDKIKEKNT